jgi:hypothetical protein
MRLLKINTPQYIFSRISDFFESKKNETSFTLEDSQNCFEYFYHNYNCGYPGKRKTERTVELSLADYWLDKVPNSWEVGAVTPYYWPGRVREIIDPADKHERVSQRKSLFDIDFTDKNILSLSTIEHIGEQSYDLNENANPIQAIEKLTLESKLMLLTFPIGWNEMLDEFVLGGEVEKLCKVRFLVRNTNETWISSSRENAYRPYGGKGISWANSLAILEKGSIL